MARSAPDHLTPQQQAALLFVCRYIRQFQIPPTNREVAEGMSLSPNAGVPQPLQRVIEKGYLERVPRTARNLRLTPKGQAWFDVQPAYPPLVKPLPKGAQALLPLE
jgi:SOS-response transcriptional repressor LexA